MNLEKYLKEHNCEDGLTTTVLGLAKAVRRIAAEIKVADGSKAGTANSSGEAQLKMDVLADRIVLEELRACGEVGLVASEEMEGEERIGEGEYAVAHDPLDGSSLLDVNFAVGSIFGVYRRGTFFGARGDDQVAALVGCYGPVTALFVTVKKGTAYFVLDASGDFQLRRDDLTVNEEADVFAPGNLRAINSNSAYAELVRFWANNAYSLRYSGGFVPDVGHILLKGKGVFAYPGDEDMPEGKLRFLFECAPLALIVEQAGGLATNGNQRILELVVDKIHQRTPIFIGSRVEVERIKDFL